MLDFFARDYDLKQMVGETGIAYRTLERRVERLRIKLGARHPHGILVKAHKRGYINLNNY